MIPMEDITPTKPVVAYGLESLVAIEFGTGTRSEGAVNGIAVRELADGFGEVGGWKVGDRRSECSC